jgi:hypothetical protein
MVGNMRETLAGGEKSKSSFFRYIFIVDLAIYNCEGSFGYDSKPSNDCNSSNISRISLYVLSITSVY